MKSGICALCSSHTELLKSHLVPQWVYSRILEVESSGEKNPVHVSDGRACYSSWQTVRHLLCKECEYRFSIREEYVARITRLKDGVPSINAMATLLPSQRNKPVLAVLSSTVEIEQLAYFAISIIWRSHAMHRSDGFGPYEPAFRNYLLGHSSAPNEAVLLVTLYAPSTLGIGVSGWMSEPASVKADGYWIHGFMVAGLAFKLLVGKKIDPQLRMASVLTQPPSRFVSMMSPEDCRDFMAAAEIAVAATPKGKLAGQYNAG
jgi:hypothetical protein